MNENYFDNLENEFKGFKHMSLIKMYLERALGKTLEINMTKNKQ